MWELNFGKSLLLEVRPVGNSRSWYLAVPIPMESGLPWCWVQFITNDKLPVKRQLLCRNIQPFVYRDWRMKGLIIQQIQAEGEKSLKPREVIIAFLHRLVLITFLYLSLTSFIKPSHKSCKVRLFSGYLHSSRVIDQRGLQHKPTWMMAFLLFSLHSLLSFYAVIPFPQNHNRVGCRSQIYLQTPPDPQPPPPSPVFLLCAALDLTPARSLGWISTRWELDPI